MKTSRSVYGNGQASPHQSVGVISLAGRKERKRQRKRGEKTKGSKVTQGQIARTYNLAPDIFLKVLTVFILLILLTGKERGKRRREVELCWNW